MWVCSLCNLSGVILSFYYNIIIQYRNVPILQLQIYVDGFFTKC